MKRYWAYKKTIIAIGVVIVLVVIGLIVILHTNKPKISSANSETPTYKTILPAGKTIAALGGWKQLNPPDGSPYYGYSDSINSVSFTVSEQQLPKNLSTDAELAQLADGFNATQNLTAGSTKIYIGTSVEGPQSLIFSKDNLLISIKSQAVISNSAWSTYISSLN